MSDIRQKPVYGRDGLLGWLEDDPGGTEPAERQVILTDGGTIRVSRDLIAAQPDGSYFLPISANQLQADPPNSPGLGLTSEHRVIPVIVEEAEVHRKQITRSVRFRKKVHEREELIDEPGYREDVQVERVPVNRVVDQAPVLRTEGETLIIPVLEEVLFVEKRLVLKEEIRVTRRRETIQEPRRVKLRSESVEIERTEPEEREI